MTNDLKELIRKALAGSNSQQPVDTKTLLSLGKSDAILFALESLKASREINTALVIKGGEQTVLCWLTGATAQRTWPKGIQLSSPSGMRAPPQRPDLQQAAAKVKPITSIPTKQKKEKSMQQRNPITNAITDIVKDQPGMKRQPIIELAMQRVKDATEQQANKALANLIHSSKRIKIMSDANGNRIHYLNDGKAAPAKAVAKKAAPAKKATETVGASSLAKPLAAKTAPATPGDNDNFSITMSEDYCVQITHGSDLVILNPGQAVRLSLFLGRIERVLEAGAL
jgi:hypothetical protein